MFTIVRDFENLTYKPGMLSTCSARLYLRNKFVSWDWQFPDFSSSRGRYGSERHVHQTTQVQAYRPTRSNLNEYLFVVISFFFILQEHPWIGSFLWLNVPPFSILSWPCLCCSELVFFVLSRIRIAQSIDLCGFCVEKGFPLFANWRVFCGGVGDIEF